jgi:predicted RNA binding protein YcfA (HicA-like mRNA interferase family)
MTATIAPPAKSMADYNRDLLRRELPHLFDPARARDDWDSDWIVVAVDDVESDMLDDLESEIEPHFAETVAPTVDRPPSQYDVAWPDDIRLPEVYVGDAAELGVVPGAPSAQQGFPPSPDALAFYLPFHYFAENVWGIYLTYEGVGTIRDYLVRHSRGGLTPPEAWHAARVFLYAHEAFHHSIESFATRLEIDRRVPLYRTGFERLYRRQYSLGQSLEEMLATGLGVQKADASAAKRKWTRAKRQALREALLDYIRTLPPNYRRGESAVDPDLFIAGQDQLGEDSRAECFGGPTLPPGVWRNAAYAFRGLINIASRVNYIVHRNSRLASRHQLDLRFFRQREVLQKLHRLAGLEFHRHGGNHDIYRAANGRTVQIPRHRDLQEGTVRAIVRQSGLTMSLEEFRAA